MVGEEEQNPAKNLNKNLFSPHPPKDKGNSAPTEHSEEAEMERMFKEINESIKQQKEQAEQKKRQEARQQEQEREKLAQVFLNNLKQENIESFFKLIQNTAWQDLEAKASDNVTENEDESGAEGGGNQHALTIEKNVKAKVADFYEELNGPQNQQKEVIINKLAQAFIALKHAQDIEQSLDAIDNKQKAQLYKLNKELNSTKGFLFYKFYKYGGKKDKIIFTPLCYIIFAAIMLGGGAIAVDRIVEIKFLRKFVNHLPIKDLKNVFDGLKKLAAWLASMVGVLESVLPPSLLRLTDKLLDLDLTEKAKNSIDFIANNKFLSTALPILVVLASSLMAAFLISYAFYKAADKIMGLTNERKSNLFDDKQRIKELGCDKGYVTTNNKGEFVRNEQMIKEEKNNKISQVDKEIKQSIFAAPYAQIKSNSTNQLLEKYKSLEPLFSKFKNKINNKKGLTIS
jgi:hypothetical protein